MNSEKRMMDGFHYFAGRTKEEIEHGHAVSVFDSQSSMAQRLAVNLTAARFSSLDDWMVYDIANGNTDAVYIGVIPAIVANTATAVIITE